VQTLPVQELSHLHMDPEGPAPGVGDGMMLADFREDAIDAFVESVVGSALLAAEVRHPGGAVGRAKPEHGALSHFEDEYLSFVLGIAPTPKAAEAAEHAVRATLAALEQPWAAAHMYSNFAETRRGSGSFHSETAHHRLKRIKAKVDPANVIRANHEL
jgi:hypothetical protein